MELWQLDATELARLIRVGQASSREAVGACLARMDAVNEKLNAVVRRMDDEALAAADAADATRAQGDALGPLHGVPVTTKLNTDQKGHPTDNGVVAFRDLIAPDDAPVVANLRAAGAVIIGRTNVPAFSMRGFSENDLHGRTLNPRDREVTPGGSSGGAGTAVATGIGPIAQGNDIAGSVRFPAYCCGIIGLRVGLGRIPSFNHTAKVARGIGGQLMSTQGPLTRTVRDARLALAVMARGDRRDTRWVDVPLTGPPPPRPIRVALVPEVPGGETHPAQVEAVRRAGRHLMAARYLVEEVLPPDIEEAARLWHAMGSNLLQRDPLNFQVTKREPVPQAVEHFTKAGALGPSGCCAPTLSGGSNSTSPASTAAFLIHSTAARSRRSDRQSFFKQEHGAVDVGKLVLVAERDRAYCLAGPGDRYDGIGRTEIDADRELSGHAFNSSSCPYLLRASTTTALRGREINVDGRDKPGHADQKSSVSAQYITNVSPPVSPAQMGSGCERPHRT